MGWITAHGCSLTECSLKTDWKSHDDYATSGLSLDVNFAYANLDDTGHGSSKINPNNAPAGELREYLTRSQSINFILKYNLNEDWSLALQIPYLQRVHYHAAPDDGGAYFPEYSRHEGIGDAHILTRYQGLLSSHRFSLELGLKLPTGSFTQQYDNASPLDRGLQLGTGTTDLIAGAIWEGDVARHLGWFARYIVQTPLRSRSDFRPGTSQTIGLGLRYSGLERFTLMLQISSHFANKEKGEEAIPENSGGSMIAIDPGVSFDISKHLSTYAFVQIPVYQYVNGYQNTASWTLSTGIRWSF